MAASAVIWSKYVAPGRPRLQTARLDRLQLGVPPDLVTITSWRPIKLRGTTRGWVVELLGIGTKDYRLSAPRAKIPAMPSVTRDRGPRVGMVGIRKKGKSKPLSLTVGRVLGQKVGDHGLRKQGSWLPDTFALWFSLCLVVGGLLHWPGGKSSISVRRSPAGVEFGGEHSREKTIGRAEPWWLPEARRHGRVAGMGTGVIVDPRGYVVTNFHVVDGVQEIQVTLANGGRVYCPARGSR